VAKAVRTAPVGSRAARPPIATPGPGRTSLVEYFRGVWDELKKVVWPTREELWRMTGIVMATVIIFAAVIGGADYLLSLGVKQVYTSSQSSSSQNSNTTTNTAPPVTSVPTAAPSRSPK